MSSDNKINVFFNEYNLLVDSRGVTYLSFASKNIMYECKKKTPLSYKLKKNHFCETVKNTEFKGYILTNASPTPLRSEKI